MDRTTIQVSDATKRRLDRLKEQSGASSYDKVIQEVLREKVDLKVPKSLAGIYPDLK